MVSTKAFLKAILLIFSATFAIAAPTSYDVASLEKRQSNGRLVFCHFMVSRA